MAWWAPWPVNSLRLPREGWSSVPPHHSSCPFLFCLQALVFPIFYTQVSDSRSPRLFHTFCVQAPPCCWYGHIYTTSAPCPICFHLLFRSLPQTFIMLLKSEHGRGNQDTVTPERSLWLSSCWIARAEGGKMCGRFSFKYPRAGGC